MTDPRLHRRPSVAATDRGAAFLRRFVSDAVDEAVGRTSRTDPGQPRSGGPAGNATLTAWVGLVLFVLLAIEAVTVLDVRGMLSWHIVVGTLLVPAALVKIGTTGWRIMRYYAGHRPYRSAGPPPMLLRLLGPIVIVSSVGVLGSGLGLIALGPASGRTGKAWLLGLDMYSVHQATFIVFGISVVVHALARLVPAFAIVTNRVERATAQRTGVPGRAARVIVVGVMLAAGAITAGLVLSASNAWQQDRGFDHGGFERHALHDGG